MADQKHSVLFWSGGKDAFLALRHISEPGARITLLTTCNEDTGVVPHQDIPVEVIKMQARHLNLELLDVPLPDPCPNSIYLERLQAVLSALQPRPDLVFGDLRLAEIRTWRESVFSGMGYSCHFPIWNKPYDKLLEILWAQPVEVYISSVAEAFRGELSPGSRYDKAFVENLPAHIDPMGENGEFHTVVRFLPPEP